MSSFLTIGFTASRNLSGVDPRRMLDPLDQLPEASRYVYGGAKGGDHAVALFLTKKFPHAQHYVVLPANRSQVVEWWKHDSAIVAFPIVECMPTGTTYKERNQRIVNLSNLLVGFPEYREHDSRSLRSGTWQTIRLARRAPIPTKIFYLRDGD